MTVQSRTDVARTNWATVVIIESAQADIVEGSPTLEEFGAPVRARRLALGLSQQALADQTGLHHTLVGHVEHRLRNLGLDNLRRLARGLEVDLGELTRGL